MHLPDHVALTASGHHGDELTRLCRLQGDWLHAIGHDIDELYPAMLDAADCFQASVFDSLHGFYRSALSNLRSILDIMAAGALGNIRPSDEVYLRWKAGHSGASLNFPNCRSRLSRASKDAIHKKFYKQSGWVESLYDELCSFVHARPDGTDFSFWHSNGPIYVERGFQIAYVFQLTTYAASYILAKTARPQLSVPGGSRFLCDIYREPLREERHHERLSRNV